MNTIKTLQTQLSRDLANIEDLAYLEPDQLKMVEDAYQEVYNILSELNKKQDIQKWMTTVWTLFLIWGQLNPTLTYLATYKDETVCRQAVKELQDSKLKSVCVPMQPENKKWEPLNS